MSDALQQRINAKIEALNKQISKLEILDMEVTLDALTGYKSKQIIPTIKDYFQNQINHLKQSGKVNTAIKYKFTLSSLLKYCDDETKMTSVDTAFVLGFEQFLLGIGNVGNIQIKLQKSKYLLKCIPVYSPKMFIFVA